MADRTIDELTVITAAEIDTAADKIPIWDDSAGETKYITVAQFLSVT
jgi:hypothetical protein